MSRLSPVPVVGIVFSEKNAARMKEKIHMELWRFMQQEDHYPLFEVSEYILPVHAPAHGIVPALEVCLCCFRPGCPLRKKLTGQTGEETGAKPR